MLELNTPTMRFLSANALWWLLLGAIIILLYLLKLKRTRRVVPSVLLWQRALEEVEANAPLRRLRRSLLLLLQLLAVAVLVFALSRPLVAIRALASGNTIIVIDATASMSSRDENGGTRLSRAKQLAREMIDDLGEEDRAAVTEAASRVILRCALTSDRAALARAVEEIQPTDAAGNLSEAVRLAEQLVKTERGGSVVVISDGGGARIDSNLRSSGDRAPGAGVSLRFVGVGKRSENVGIVAMNSRSVRAGGRQALFASIANFGDLRRSFVAQLLIDGRLVDARTVNLEPKSREALVFDSLPAGGGLAELKLDVGDELSADDAAYCFVPDSRRLRVGVATGNPFLLGALAVNEGIDARRIETASEAAVAQFDCVIGEGSTPATVLASNRPLLLINAPDVAGMFRSTGQIERPEIGAVSRGHPVNRFLSFADLHVETAKRLETANWLTPILETNDGDGLIWAGQDGKRRIVVVAFDLTASDFPLKVEFPIFVASAISWLAGQDQADTSRSIRAGQPAIIATQDSTATVRGPEGKTTEVKASSDGSLVFDGTLKVGEYQVEGGEPFAVSLLSESESDTTPREALETRSGEVRGQRETFKSEREVWRWLAFAALVVLTVEWWAYHRRIF